MDLKQLHQLKCELLKVYRYQGLTLQELLCEFYSHINEVINSTNGLIDIVDYLVGEGLSNEVATHLNQMLIDGTFDKIISNKVDELSTNLNNQFNEMKKIIESNISESDKLIENLRVYDSRFNNIESKNIDQDTRLKDIENKNKVQDVYISGLFNENKDGRLSIEGEGNNLKLEGSKEGLVEVDKIVGNTLVNLSPKMDGKWYINNYIAYYSNKMDTSLFKPNTEFTIIIYNAPNTLLNSLLDGITTSGSMGTIYKFTSKSSFSNNCYFHIYKKNSEPWTSDELKDCKFAILEGDYTNKPIPIEAFEGLESSFEGNLVTQEMVNEGLEDAENLGKYKVPVKLVGKNKFKGTFENGKAISSSNGEVSDSSTKSLSDYIIINRNTTYTLSGCIRGGLCFYDKNKNFISGVTTVYTFTTPNNAFYLRFNIINTEDYSNVQLEEGTVATDFEDYFERTINVYLNSPLLEGDEIVMKDGELCHYHKRSKVVLDGSNDEGIQFATTWSANADIVIFTSLITSNVAYADKNKNYLIADNALTDTYNQWVVYKNGVNKISVQESSTSGNRLLWSLPKDEYTLDSFKQKLQSSPTTIVYELAEPYYEPISTDKLLLECTNDSTLHIDSIVPVENIVASYTGNVPSVYAIEETGITNTEDIAVTQTAVDFLLMSSMGESLMISFLNNVKGINNLGSYFANRIIKKALSYDDVINKYPQFKDDIDVILINEGYEYLIK